MKVKTMDLVPSIPPIIDRHPSDDRVSKIATTVAIAGHAFHPLLVTFGIRHESGSIAFSIGTTKTDLGYLLTQDLEGAKAA